jgi:tetratricopeptide (TPR) repeat protein
MRSPHRVLLCFFIGTLLHAEPSEKSLRYHQLLAKKPQPGTVLDRFVDAWLETESAPALLDFLKAKTTANEATANDHLLLALYLAQQATDDSASLAAFEKATQLAPENPIAWQQKARLESRMLDFPRALASLDAAIAQHPEPKLALDLAKLRGRTLLRLGRTPENPAVEAYMQKQMHGLFGTPSYYPESWHLMGTAK